MKFLKKISAALLLSLLLGGAVSCSDGPVYDKEGDCSPTVQFVFKKHRQALQSLDGRIPDAFYSTVKSVHLFVYDAESGELVYDKYETTDNLSSASELNLGTNTDRCFMKLDVPEGKYRIVTWCGLDESDHNNAFYLNEDQTRSSYGKCDVKLASALKPVNAEKYESLFHGVVKEVEVSFNREDRQIIPVELTKNTNDIAVFVQHARHTFDKDEYEVVYTDANGTMHFEDNSLLGADRLEYHPHTASLLTSETEYNGSMVEAGALVAHISTARLMEAHKNDARIEVRDRFGTPVFSIPFIKYVTQMQTLTDDSQYYLDCEDTYNCSFYLTGDSETWVAARIIINNWVIVPEQESEL